MNELYHYGTPRHSGRYPWGSGEDPYQHEDSFLKTCDTLRAEGMSDTEIAKAMGMSTTEWRTKRANEIEQKKAYDISLANKLKEKGMSNVAIAKRMDISEGTVRNLLKGNQEARKKNTELVSDLLRNNVDEKGYIDIGKGVNLDINTSEATMKKAVQLLKEEGYVVHNLQVKQLGTDNYTTVKVLCPPGTKWSEVNQNRDKIKTITDYISDNDGENTILGIKPPENISSDRIKIKYYEDGGNEMDGVIQLRRGVNDISLGDAQYAQVRIAVDGTHYLKGMAMYSDNLPDGVDILFNTNKHKGTPMLGEDSDNTVLKKMKADDDNPFGATIKRQQGAINIVNEEGDWGKWSKSLASQMLSKQSTKLAEQQLNIAFDTKKSEFIDISKITIPSIKKQMLEQFADECDAAAVHLKAAALPRQASKVILPITSLKDNEIYAPSYRNGEEVVLIRYPHAGTFEIPRLIVNNSNKEAKAVMNNAIDGVGINHKVAQRLSGADFDGDSVLVIPTATANIRTKPALNALKDFDPSEAYPGYSGMKKMSERTKQIEMGKISNLITDMTLKGAPDDEVARAVKHSMCVIDAVKHNLDYKRSEKENDIQELKELYQSNPNKKKAGGASTLISLAKSEERVPERKLQWKPDPETGKKVYKETGRVIEAYTDKNGKYHEAKLATSKVKRMDIHDDAFELSSGHPMETLYANYANGLKAMANQARKESLAVRSDSPSQETKKTYAKEVDSLNAKLNNALKNTPRERQAQLVANEVVKLKKKSNPDMTKEEEKKISYQALAAARARYGANKKNVQVQINDDEWKAIEAGAISGTKLKQILNNTDIDIVKEHVMPRNTATVSESKKALIKTMNNNGYDLSEIADRLGISTSTVSNVLK